LETPTLRRSPTNISIGDEYLGLMGKLPQLEQKINDRIQQAKNNMHPTHNRAYIESSLNIEIETLNWVLNEILVLIRRDPDV
jgi:hypothetical protein